jgi:aryl-alcohol dehydrogenase-like predicted oxidoreductase
LASLGVALASNTVELSLLEQSALADGTVATCQRLGVAVLAGAPLAHGLCSGRYTASNPTGGKFVKNPRQTQRFRADDLRQVRVKCRRRRRTSIGGLSTLFAGF